MQKPEKISLKLILEDPLEILDKRKKKNTAIRQEKNIQRSLLRLKSKQLQTYVMYSEFQK